MQENLSLNEIKKEWHGTYKAYAIGFVSCLFLTAISFALVSANALSAPLLISFIIALALVQAAVQLRFFLHLGEEAKPRWKN